MRVKYKRPSKRIANMLLSIFTECSFYLYREVIPPVLSHYQELFPTTAASIKTTKHRDYNWRRRVLMLQIVTRATSKQQQQQQQKQQQERQQQQQQIQQQQFQQPQQRRMTGKSIDFSLCPKFVPNVTDPDTWLDKWHLFHDMNKTLDIRRKQIRYIGLIFKGYCQ